MRATRWSASVAARCLLLCGLGLLVPARAEAQDAGSSRHRFFLRLAIGPGYLHETWNPHDGTAGATYSGWAPVVEIAAGHAIVPRLVVGGGWQFAGVHDPNEGYLGTTYVFSDTFKVVNIFSAFGDYLVSTRLGLRVGASIGLATTSIWDTYVGNIATSWGEAVAPYLAYQRRLSGAWSLGAIGRLTVYRAGFHETPSSASSTGLLPSLTLAVTFG